ncbi:acylphosphatase [Candidatus Dependentiae bacterium]
MKRCLKIRVVGKVQDVLYRQFVQKVAYKLGIEGTAHNAEDGSVLINAAGLSEKLDDFIDALYKGSPKSKVENIIVEPLIPERDFRGVFRIIGENKNK